MITVDAIKAVRAYLVENSLVDVETGPGSVVRVSEDGEILGVIALADAYVEEVKSADAIKADLRNQQTAQRLRTNKPAKRGKRLMMTMRDERGSLRVRPSPGRGKRRHRE